jgi:hypothetical protein
VVDDVVDDDTGAGDPKFGAIVAFSSDAGALDVDHSTGCQRTLEML